MINIYQNITQILMVHNAIGAILDKIGKEINSHSACIITDKDSTSNKLSLGYFPSIRGDCRDNNIFVDHLQHGVTIGCSYFLVCEGCALEFLDNFHKIHDWVEQKYEKKVLVVIDTERVLTFWNVSNILTHTIVINDLPFTILLQPNDNNEWIDIWSAYPYSSDHRNYNRVFLSNSTFQYDKKILSKLSDLNGLTVVGALMNYPPYTSYAHVPPGSGNAHLYGSNESLSLYLDGQEHIILVEFCLKYNCTLTARLEYDEELWGKTFHNQTGVGLLGALATRDANVSVAAMYLWDDPYEFTQYSTIIQRATATQIVPKPIPLPYWQTPLLPFPTYIWGYVIGTFLFGAVTLYIVNIYQTRMDVYQHRYRHFTSGLFDSIYAVFRMSLFQDVKINIKFLSNIAIFTVLLNFSFVIGNLYSGGLASVMTITRFETPVDSVEKLVESNFIFGGTTWIWLQAIMLSDYPPHKQLIKNYLVKSIPEIHTLVQQHKMAVTVEMLQHGTLSYQEFLDKESSKYYMIMKHPIYSQHTTVMATKTWPFMEQLNRIVFMQQESGIRYYWERIAATRIMDYDIQRNLEENGKPPQSVEPVKLSIEHVIGAMFLFLFGNVVATIAFFVELLFNHYNMKRYNHIDFKI